MAEFPDDIYTPRETENLPGIVYNPADKKNMYSEDFQNLGAEINAIEEILGTNPEGIYDTVKLWLENLTTAIEAIFLAIPTGGDEGQVLTKVSDDDYDTEWADGGGGGGGALPAQAQVISVTLSSANITGMKVTPVQIIPAPGVGKAIVVTKVTCSFKYNSVQYTGGGTVKLIYSGFTQALNSETFLDDNTLKGTSAEIRSSGGINNCIVKENTAVKITNTTADFASGNSTPQIIVNYVILDIP